jgi:ACR3 family arsenite efflux pump ArsB
MSETTEVRRLNVFERYLTLWVGVCMVIGIALGKVFPDAIDALRRLEFGGGSQINVPIAVLIWLMIYPMMLKVDFASVLGVVWSYLTRGDAAYTLVQVSVNDLLMLVLFAPIVQLLVTGASSLTVPFMVLVYAVICFIVIPLAAGVLTRIDFSTSS